MKDMINKLFASQLADWELAGKNFEALQYVDFKQVKMADGEELILQFNPARIVSSSAKVDKKSLANRACFLCAENRPAEQEGIAFGDDFLLLVNPFPILRKHFTIVNTKHTPQEILPYISQMLEISAQMGEEYTLFYNGAKCGASAPDHMHFQAGISAQFPIWNLLENKKMEMLVERGNVQIKAFSLYANGILLESESAEEITQMTKQIIAELAKLQPQEAEPMLNVLAKYENSTWKIVFFPRDKHRPNQYFEEGEKQLMLSPASVDFGGLLAVPRKEDFERIDMELLEDVFAQLRLNDKDFNELKTQIKQL